SDSNCESKQDENTDSESEVVINDVWDDIDTPARLESFDEYPSMVSIQEFLYNTVDAVELFLMMTPYISVGKQTLIIMN
ncbi:hypothetical protein NPIL_59491, partial [Nephila pilipes]